ncbi:hypothetical protein ACFXPS_05920 [Nocardia sp. NPDC059091]|uniref:hypothetical protein n=1 Tax=unclassified Nocardia TaxID=2637762 RepID=UPI0036873C43
MTFAHLISISPLVEIDCSMKMHTVVPAAAMLAATLIAAATPAAADPTASPDTPSVGLAPAVHYTAYQSGPSALISTDSGSLTIEGGRFQIRAATGEVLGSIPLEFNLDDIALPIDAHIDGNTATLTPSLDPARAHYKPAALPFEDQAPFKTPYDREVAAWGRLASTVTTAAAGGAMVGAIGAGLIGCLLGGATAGLATGPVAMLFGAGPLAGCLIGAAALAPVGVLGGAIFVGAPIAAAAVIQYFATVNAPFNPPAAAK